MYTVALPVAAPVVGQDQSHQDCRCVGLVVALPDGVLNLYAENVADLEALGWGILAAVEQIKSAQPAPEEQPVHEHPSQGRSHAT